MIKIAIQKNGRLSDLSLALLKSCGINTPNGDRKLKSKADNFPLEILYLRDDDIPEYVEKGVADIGIIGENEVWEKDKDVIEIFINEEVYVRGGSKIGNFSIGYFQLNNKL